MLGTIMAANVFFVIIPAHWELVRARQAGREPDPAWNLRGKQRSVHNNYFTLPVLLAMLSNHFSFVYAHAHAWVVLVCMMVLGALIRHFFNLRHRGQDAWWIVALAGAGIVAIAVSSPTCEPCVIQLPYEISETLRPLRPRCRNSMTPP